MDSFKRQLTIYCNIVQRLEKEIGFYQQEIMKQNQRVKYLETSNANIHDIRKQREVLQESVDILPDSKKRLEQSLLDLECFLQKANPDNVKNDDQCVIQARSLLSRLVNANIEMNSTTLVEY